MTKVRVGVFVTVMLLIILPYVQASRAAEPDYRFGGFFLNPMDGNTYLAKMRQGWEGAWQFKLPYTAEPGEGSYLFLFYLFLGHVGRITGLPLLLVFHIARVGAAVVLLIALDRFYRKAFVNERTATLAYSLAALGAGMGWLAALGRWVSADMWVAEAYPFLASFSNPHFPLSLALMVWLVSLVMRQAQTLTNPQTQAAKPPNHRNIRLLLILGFKSFAGGLALSLLSPFGAIIVGLVLTGTGLWHGLAQLKMPAAGSHPTDSLANILGVASALAGLLLGSAPVMLYDFWIARIHPALAGWNAQNITPTPPVWDVVLSLSPALLFAVVGAWAGWRQAERRLSYQVFVLWVGITLTAIFIPVSLQLRFMIGLFIPIAGLAAAGIERLAPTTPRRWRNLTAILFGLTLPSVLFIQLAAIYSIQSRSSAVYLTRGEALAMQWIEANLPGEALILAAPDTGLLIPAYTGLRVIYGHPFETVNAEKEKESVEKFFRADSWNDEQRQEFLQQRRINYLFFGPRERALGQPEILKTFRVVYQADQVTIYGLQP